MPSQLFDQKIHEVLEATVGHQRVVFHCMLSQCRGPQCCAAFARVLDETQSDLDVELLVLRGGINQFIVDHAKQDYCDDVITDYDSRFWD